MVYPNFEVIHINVILVNANKNVTEILLILKVTENALLFCSSYLGVEGEFKHFIER